MKYLSYSRQSIDERDIEAVAEVLRSDFVTQGPKTEEFETALARYCGAKFAVTVSSGTAALHAAYSCAGIGKGDEIITSPNTFVATANAALYVGARPVFVDIEPDTGNIDARLIEVAVNRRTKAVVPVHFAGHPADLGEILETARKHGLVVIEDGCHALGGRFRSKKIGSISDMTVFSFHPVKSITTGEGGAVLTDDEEFYRKLIAFRSHGIVRTDEAAAEKGGWYREMRALGFNYRLSDIHAALGLSQLRRLDSFIADRDRVARRYGARYGSEDRFSLPPVRDYADSAWHLYPLRLNDRLAGKKKKVFDSLRSAGIGVQVHYPPVYRHPYYRDLGYPDGLCPAAEDYYHREMSVPLFPGMSDEVFDKITEEIDRCLR